MLRKLTFFLLLLPALVLGQSRASRPVSDFHSLDLRGGFEVELTQARGHSLEIEASEGLMDQIHTRVDDGVLIVETKGRIREKEAIKLYISSPTFRQIEASGAVDLSATTPLAGRALAMNISGAGDIDLALALDELRVDISGAGDVRLKGEVDEVEYYIAGAGEIEADELEAREVVVNVSGAGSARVYATRELDVSIAGVGSVYYRGNPEIARSIAGLGELKAL